jgi:tRNA-2-methylthio-N6-dimethylallyladenosine synthase
VTTFADLLARIHDEVPAIQRLRFVTSYPRDFGDDVLEVIRDHPRICRYVHVPGPDRVGPHAQDDEPRVHRRRVRRVHRPLPALPRPARDRPPAHALGRHHRGLPDRDRRRLRGDRRPARAARYKNCFIFKYSPRPGTVAYDKIPDDVPESVKRERNNHLLAVQARSPAQDRPGAALTVGREFDAVLFEGPQPRPDDLIGQEARLTCDGELVEARHRSWSVRLPLGRDVPDP